jgi:5'-deoxynucleotidase YfbR-like HD superfamily hydrolase
MKDAKKFAELFHSMSAINRFSQFRLVNPESVLEHTGMVAIATMMLCDMSGATVSVELAALRHALVHDMDEILTGDISNPTKYHSKKSEAIFEEIADANMRKVCYEYDFQVYQNWNTASPDVYAIVKMADVLAVFYKAYQEIDMFGNRTMVDAIEQLIPATMRAHARFIEQYPSATEVTDLCEDVCETIRYLRGQ